MKNKREKKRLKTFTIRYTEKCPGFDQEFTMHAIEAEDAIKFVACLFPGRGDFTCIERPIQ